MKKIYLSICALAISFSSIAQLSLENFTVDKNKKIINIKSTPSREDVSSQIQEQLIVELYSK